MRSRRGLVVAALWLSCAHPRGTASRSPPPLAGAAELYPLEPGDAWSYEVVDAAGEKTLTVSRVIDRQGARARVDSGGGKIQELEVTAEAITRRPSGAVALRMPIVTGNRWSLPDGGEAEIARVDARAEVPAGTYEPCVAVEERYPDRRVVTTYARRVGPVLIEVYAKMGSAEPLVFRGVLRGYHAAGTPTL
jgi:hypothetical protein